MSEPVMQRLKISREGIILIKSFEGFRPRAVRRDDGRWVIGYGHTLSAREGATVSEQDAELLLRYDLIPVAQAVNEGVAAGVNQHQFDALASFAFSVGVDRFQASDVLSRLNAGSADEAADAMVGWPEARPPLDAALRRRAAERALFVADPAWPVALADLLAAPLPPPPSVAVVEPDDAEAHETVAIEAGPQAEPVTEPYVPTPRDVAVAALLVDPSQRRVQTEDGDAAPEAPSPDIDAPTVGDASVDPVSLDPVSLDPVSADPVEQPDDVQAVMSPPTSPAGLNQRYSPYAKPIIGPLPARPAVWTPMPASAAPQIGRFGEEAAEPAASPGWTVQQPAPPAVDFAPAVEAQTPAVSDRPVSDEPAADLVDTALDDTASVDTASAEPPSVTPTFTLPAAFAPPPVEPLTPLQTPAASSSLWRDVPTVQTTDFSPQPMADTSIIPAWPNLSAQAGGDHDLPALTPMPEGDAFAAAQRLVWPHDEAAGHTPALFDDDDGSLRLSGAPIIRHEPLEDLPLKRVAWREMGAFLVMGGFGLVSFGMAMAAFRRASQSTGSNELTIIAVVLALLGAACVGVAAYNLYRRWGREDPE